MRAISLLAGVVCVAVLNAVAGLNDGLVAYYPFNGNANDASANGNHASTYGGLSYVGSPAGQGVRFDGIDDYILIPSHASRNFTTGCFSVVFWFRTTEQDYGYMLDSRTSSPERGYELIIHAAHPGVVFEVQFDPAAPAGRSVGPLNNNYQDGRWHCVAGIRGQTNLSLYMDGVLLSTIAVPAELNVGGAKPVYLGRRFSIASPADYYTGDLDEVRIYNRALSASEVLQLAGGLNAGLVAYYPFNGNANDASGNGNNGYLAGTTQWVTDRFGAASSACGLDGSTGYVLASNSPSLNMNGTAPITIALWAYRTGDTLPFHLVSKRQGEGTTQYQMACDSVRGLSFGGNNPGLPDTTTDHVSTHVQLQLNRWTHLVGVYGAGQFRFYIDGSLVATSSGTLGPSLTSDVRIGAIQSASGLFPGYVDDVRIYNRALSGTEVVQLHNGVSQPYAVSSVSATRRGSTKLVDVTYTLSGPGLVVSVSAVVSTNGGATFDVPATSCSGSGYGSAVTPGNNRTFVWDAGTDWNSRYSSQVRVKVIAGGADGQSTSFVLDTRDAGNRPIVEDVVTTHCDRLRHVYFLDGVPLTVAFTAKVNWNGKTPGAVRFVTPSGTNSALQYARSFNVGGFGAGGAIAVIAVAADGTESLPTKANCDVIVPPLGISPAVINVSGSGSLQYKVLSFGLDLADFGIEHVPKDEDGDKIPGFHDKAFKLTATLRSLLVINGDGTAFCNSFALDMGDGIDVGGAHLTPSFDGSVRLSYVEAARTWQVTGELHAGLPDADFSTPAYYVWYAPPVYLEGSFSGSLMANVYLTGWDGARPILSGDFPLEVGATFIIGCGADDLLAIEGGIGGKALLTLQWPNQPTLKNLGVNLNGTIHAVCLSWQKDWGFLDYTWWLVGGAQVAAVRPLASVASGVVSRTDLAQFRSMPRDYLKPDYLATGMGTQQIAAMGESGLGIPGGALTVLQANVYPYSEPALAVSGSNRMMVWTADLGRDARPVDENRTGLVWSKWTGTGWATPTSVWDDATADFSPVLTLFSNGVAIAAWQNERRSLTNGASLGEALAGLEVAVARYDQVAGVWVSTNLTDNGSLDRNPKLMGAPNGTALLVWTSNRSNDMTGTATCPNTIPSRRWNGTTWVDAGSIATNAAMPLWSTIAWNGSTGVFLAAIDGDDDQSTIGDQELFGAVFDGSTWSSFAQLTTNAVQDTRPQATFDSRGNLLIAWYQGSNILMRAGDLNLSSPSIVGEVGGSSSAKDFRLVTGPAGQISMVWADIGTDGSGPDPFMFNYDPAMHAWSKPLRLVNNTNLLERSFSPAYATNGALLMAYNQVHLQTDTNGVPVFTNNTVDLMFMDYLIGGDVGIGASGVTLSTNNAMPGQTVDVVAVVRNLGELAATNIAVAFYAGDPANGGSLIGSTQTVTQLAAGDSTNVQVSWAIPLSVSNQSVYVVVDPALTQEDRNRANNTASLVVLSPDLCISEMSAMNSAPVRRTINARIVNTGGMDSGAGFDVEFRRGATNGALIGSVALDALPSGGQYDANIEWNLGGETFTSAYETVYTVADRGGVVLESDRDNNVGFVQIATTLDSDNDGLTDVEELHYASNPQVQDSDGDGLNDGDEVHVYGTSPVMADSDGDGMNDGDEVRAGTDPNSKDDVFAITSVDAATGLTLVQWTAKSNKTYQVVKSMELLSWTNAASAAGADQQSQQTAPSNTVLRYVDPESGANVPLFYRVGLVE